LFSGEEDDEITDYFIRTAFPPEAHTAEVLAVLQQAEDGASLAQLERQTNLTHNQIEKVLKILQTTTPAPVSKRDSRWYANPVRHVPDQEKIAQLTRLREAEQARMREYAQSRECLMVFLGRELDDATITPCGRCAVCRGGPWLPETYAPALAIEATQFLRRSDQPIPPRKRWPEDALAAHGWQGPIAPTLRAEPGRALCLWGDEGWGEAVRRGKQENGHFDDTLATALAEMIRERWRQEIASTWVTCVPSLQHPQLVPDFAARLAHLLALPFLPSIRKMRATEPQKAMQNSYQQARNLAGAFTILPQAIRPGPVLLVDDVVDSGWTFTVLAALLRDAGSGPVIPVALAVATPSGN
jgi:ATP-dependent DNA helicase RecQ